ncbi:hypothetical protein TcWFU_003512 [Taenia crassiceps]|uniref:Nibrin second BRCT domain-containing protein n=1 Tax=Taenia crassiceps TaxID=6207 RepID=A0ABR4QGI2_9CEST
MRVSYPEEAVDADSHMVPDLKIMDVSRFGTLLNGSRIARNVVTSVPPDSNITFGAMPGVTVATLVAVKIFAILIVPDSDASKFYANPKRRLVFDGKTFVFLAGSKFQRFCFLLNLTNAKSVCIAETLSSDRQYFMNIFASVSDPCVLYETGNATPELDLAYSVLKEDFNRRPILEQEIALAIIESSCENYCNATCPCPISNTRRLLNYPVGYKSWDLEMPSATISKGGSNLKRFRENVGSDNEVVEINESKLKRRCGQAPLLLPSTLFDKPKGATRRPRTSVPDICRTNTFAISQNSSSVPEKDKNPQSGFRLGLGKPKVPVDGNLEDDSGKDDPLLEAFGSMPSLSSVLKERRSLSSYQASSEKSNDGSDANRKPHVLAPLLENPDTSLDLTTQEQENPAPDICRPPQSSSTNGFLSKGKDKQPISTDGSDVNVKTKVCALVNSAVLPRKLSRPEAEPPAVDFKRFVKVWPTCHKEALSGRRGNIPKSKSPVRITLVPFVPNSKVSAELPKWHPGDGPSQSLNEDTALINKLFDEITALPRVRRR